MMLKTSSRKVNPFLGMLKFTLAKNLGIIILVTIAALLYCPGHYLTNFEYYYNSYAHGSAFSIDMIEELLYTVSVIAGILVTLFNFMNFTYMYQKRSSDVFHSFPLTRNELLISRMLASFIQVLIPVTVIYGAYTVMWIFNPWMSSSLAQILISYFHTILVMLVCSSFSMIFVVSAGSMFDLALSFIGANGAILVVAAIINFILEEMLVGYTNSNLNEIMKAVSPLYYSGIGITDLNDIKRYGISNQTVEYIIVSIVYTIVFTAITLALYNYRKAEKGGQAYAFKYIYIICSILAGVCGGYLVGYMFAEGDFNPIFWIFATIGAILVCTVYGAVTNRGFKGVKLSVLMGVISSVLLASIAIVAVTGCFGFTNRVPSADKVESASIRYFDENIEFDDQQKVIDFHKKILEADALFDRNNYEGNVITRWIYFNYTLSDGSTMSRGFHIIPDKVLDTLQKLYESEERITTVKKQFDKDTPHNINVCISGEATHSQITLTNQQFKEMLDCYKADLKSGDIKYVIDKDWSVIQFEWKKSNSDYSYQYYTFDFSQEFTKTYSLLDSLEMFSQANQDNQNLDKK